MCDHGHGHGESCSHEAVEQQPLVFDYNLYQYIVLEQVNTLNESRDGDGKLVFKSMDSRNDRTKFVESDADAELLFKIPFSAHVRLTGLCISGDQDASHPARVKLYKDRPAMSFDDCSAEPEQMVDVKQDPAGEVDYPLKTAKFNNVSHLSIFIERNFGADETKVYYIGLRGEYQQDILRGKVPITTYELNPNVADHKGEIPEAIGKTLF
ncbi:hypothetical protein WR25_12843 [Diploscapter pachys]|uniref:PITH domain-containing protein n=1 Tax=Diploscapter pachys TaxID=2018661 RepID=A0A2A2JB46_9BILA|nr:hypothetical protein WR25_12843 [Diploscapter pachys]